MQNPQRDSSALSGDDMGVKPQCVCVCVCVCVSDCSEHSGVPDGMFRKPSKGQSLISYLSEQDFGSCADLEKVTHENHYEAHSKSAQIRIIFVITARAGQPRNTSVG